MAALPRARARHHAVEEGEDLSALVVEAEHTRSTGEAALLQVLQIGVHSRRPRARRSMDGFADADDSMRDASACELDLALH
jgi:hypothetical protein